jgi:hypothetical protein
MSSVFERLSAVNVNGHTEEKNGLTYLSWVWAWAEVKKAYPTATYTVYERPDGCIYWTDGRTCWVKTGVTIEGLEHIEYLPVKDYKNKSIPLNAITSMDVNTAIQRSIVKACARHGLGLYIYAGEDVPESAQPDEPAIQKPQKPARNEEKPAQPEEKPIVCRRCGKPIQPQTNKQTGKTYTPAQVARTCDRMCPDCYRKSKAVK